MLKLLISVLGLAAMADSLAEPGIDFVNKPNIQANYESVSCQAEHKERGTSHHRTAHQNRIAWTVNLKDLLTGDTGGYRIVCTAVQAGTGLSYTATLDAVKFSQTEPGSVAQEYDENGNGYGLSIPASGRIDACYDHIQAVMNQQCLYQYYGSQSFYLEQAQGPSNVHLHGKAYSSSVGVSFMPNPYFQAIR